MWHAEIEGIKYNMLDCMELRERTQPDETMMTLQLVNNERSQENKHDVGEIVGESTYYRKRPTEVDDYGCNNSWG